jgi:hypothetical protein
MNSILKDDTFPKDVQVENIETLTLDRFCEVEGMKNIDFLKIDTEGYDLEILKGAETMLKKQAIDFVQVEAGMNARNTRHVPFADFVQYLASRDYTLFGLYDQHLEWNGDRMLRFCNPVFISRNAASKFRG